MTCSQLEASAHAPCTRTTVGRGVFPCPPEFQLRHAPAAAAATSTVAIASAATGRSPRVAKDLIGLTFILCPLSEVRAAEARIAWLRCRRADLRRGDCLQNEAGRDVWVHDERGVRSVHFFGRCVHAFCHESLAV